MKRDVSDLKVQFKKIKDDDKGAETRATPHKNDSGNSKKPEESNKQDGGGQGMKGKAGRKELTEEQKKINEEKKAAGLARQAQMKAKNAEAVPVSPTTASNVSSLSLLTNYPG